MTKDYYSDYQEDQVFFHWKDKVEKELIEDPLDLYSLIQDYCWKKKSNDPYWNHGTVGINESKFWWFRKPTRLQRRLSSMFILLKNNESLLDQKIKDLFSYDHNIEEFVSWYMDSNQCPDRAYEILEDN